MVALLDLSPLVPPGPRPVNLRNAVRAPFHVHPPHSVAMLVVQLRPKPKREFCVGLWSVGEPAPRARHTGPGCRACKPRDQWMTFDMADHRLITLRSRMYQSYLEMSSPNLYKPPKMTGLQRESGSCLLIPITL